MEEQQSGKRCCTCGLTKAVQEFYRKADSKDGLFFACKTCWKAHEAKRRLVLGMKPRTPLPRIGRKYDVPDGQKYCPACSQIKPCEDFYPSKKKADGRFGWCRACDRMDQERRRRAKGIKPRVDLAPEKRCPRCGVTKPIEAFARDPRRPRGINSYCKPCYREYSRQLAKKYAAKTRARLRKKGKYRGNSKHVLAAAMVNMAVQLGTLQKGPCAVCGAEKVQAHHTDYTKPLEVTWLCHLHHRHAHGQLLDQQ